MSYRDGRKNLACNSLVKSCQSILKTKTAQKRSTEKQLILTGTSNTLLLVDSSPTSITYKLVTLLIKVPCQAVSNQFFMKQMFALKEKNIGEKFEFFDQNAQENGLYCMYFLFCVTEHLRQMACSVIEINICLQNLQEIIIYKTIKENFTAISKGNFK